ncbi:AAA family ATPase [Oceanimonas baumannii]|uniref:Pilus assembly protein CpaE n=1 Tax=Oceanimonas baumannii TaxID=129578 RepID=A0A235CLS6_9GAMM|nr:hypothetical protein [Oceanimonas baumannii]OYD25389.1 hypothetical protein B6S09_03995 [Oceanimonas baumannii]TDW61419.1 pilus assembly protein CpaE [Oceanimonas baumannii]
MEQTFIVYSSNEQDIDWLRNALIPHQVLVADKSAGEILSLCDATGASVIFVGMDTHDMTRQCNLIESLLAARPLLTVVGMGDGLENELIINAMRAGARDFIVYGMRSNEVMGLVHRLSQRTPAVPARPVKKNATLIYGAQSSPDAALASVMLATGLQQQGKQVLLIDLGSPVGEAQETLGLEPGFSFQDALRNLKRLDSNLIESAFNRHQSGLCLLTGMHGDPEFHQISSTDHYLLQAALNQHFDHVVINLTGQQDSEQLRSLAGMCSQIYWYTDQSMSCCKRNLAVLKHWRDMGVRLEHAGLLIDHYISQVAPDKQAMASTFELPLIAAIATDPVNRLKVKNAGLSQKGGAAGNLSRAYRPLMSQTLKSTPQATEKSWLKRVTEAFS